MTLERSYRTVMLYSSLAIMVIAAAVSVGWFFRHDFLAGGAGVAGMVMAALGYYLVKRGRVLWAGRLMTASLTVLLMVVMVLEVHVTGRDTPFVLLAFSGLIISIMIYTALVINTRSAFIVVFFLVAWNIACLVVVDNDAALGRLPLLILGIVLSTVLIGIYRSLQIKAENALLQNESRLARAMDAGRHAFWEWDLKTNETFFSPRYFTMLGYEVNELPMEFSTWEGLLHPEDKDKIISTIMSKIKAGEPYTVQFRLRAKDGHYRWIMGRGNIYLTDKKSGTQKAVGTHEDITDRKESEERLVYLAKRDPLTGAYNRNGMREQLDLRIAESLRDNVTRAFMLIDINNFKQLNDRYGSRAGDQALKVFAERISSCLRKSDILARSGGDEFAVYLHNLKDELDGGTVARKVRVVLSAPVTIDVGINERTERQDITLTVNMGICFFRKQGNTQQQLFSQADAALLQAKRQGKNRFCFYDETINRNERKRQEVVDLLTASLENDRVIPFFQPIVDEKGRVVKFESLARIVRPDRSLVSPGEFIPVAEETGLIKTIGTVIMEKSCQVLKRLQARWPRLKASVNVSSRQLTSELYDIVMLVLQKTGISPDSLYLEITEATFMEDTGAAAEIISRIREEGVRFSLDDFGTGYSSLSRIKHLPIDEFKIDRAFVQDILREEDGELNRTIIKALVEIARSRDVSLVVEGAETEAEIAALRKLGCPLIQGYYFSKPLDEEGFQRYLETCD